MLDIHRTDDVPDRKFYFTHSLLPTYIDPQNVSTKKQPFATFNKQRFSHTLDLILPEEIYELLKQRLDAFGDGQYARVHMKLGEILEPEFVNDYIKQGNIMMLSEGRPLIDNHFELYEGVLKMELDRPTYERCGLQGTPIEDGGKKHQKQRWIVTCDLRSPSMKHGKGDFSRLEWACKNVLDQSLTWLFHNFNPSSIEALAEGKETISKYAPWIQKMEPSTSRLESVSVPRLSVNDLPGLYGEDEALDLQEYIYMLSLESPRVNASDNIDPHLSRYEVPDMGNGVSTTNMVLVRWKGFIPSTLARNIFLGVQKGGFKSKSKINGTQDVDMGSDAPAEVGKVRDEPWFAMSAQAFGGKNSWTALQFSHSLDTLLWQIDS
jgi:ribonuclease P/MRP protein subunit RPP40